MFFNLPGEKLDMKNIKPVDHGEPFSRIPGLEFAGRWKQNNRYVAHTNEQLNPLILQHYTNRNVAHKKD